MIEDKNFRIPTPPVYALLVRTLMLTCFFSVLSLKRVDAKTRVINHCLCHLEGANRRLFTERPALASTGEEDHVHSYVMTWKTRKKKLMPNMLDSPKCFGWSWGPKL
ncbi:LOW QUALITY PROTEIN: hypothetical protein OSB04_006522 [Centaurea solstitialis]|uniref:Uncharacterized protein n=1 Tax=Centaurea solstitialis TaxID=347529 RepID=A0AA38WHR4_9ASTR|nr:LOW QUALITY PROTEIN: hypothetical protein OSB04_006522 [Centaurea solstitialis]